MTSLQQLQAAKVISKLNIAGFGHISKDKGQQNGDDDTPVGENVAEPHSPAASDSTEKYCHFVDAHHHLQKKQKGTCCHPGRTRAPTTAHEAPGGPSSRNSDKFPSALKISKQIPGSCMSDELQQSPKSGGSTDSHGNSSFKVENESSLIVDCEILWEDISLKEEIGRGKTD